MLTRKSKGYRLERVLEAAWWNQFFHSYPPFKLRLEGRIIRIMQNKGRRVEEIVRHG